MKRLICKWIDENTAVTSRLAEVEKERDELNNHTEAIELEQREQIEHLCNQRDEAEGKCMELETALASSRALVAKKDEALKAEDRKAFKAVGELAGEYERLRIRYAALYTALEEAKIELLLGSKFNRQQREATIKRVDQALALTESASAGTLVDAAELAELRRDRERLDWAEKIPAYIHTPKQSGSSPNWCVVCDFPRYALTLRAAIDAARQRG